jgi:predicted ribosome quality control (RQC) complex YloA/Tae2 family protein
MAEACLRVPPFVNRDRVPAAMTDVDDTSEIRERFTLLVRALRKYRGRLARKLEALRSDLAEAERAPTFRRNAETLLVYLRQVPARAASITLPDPGDPAHTLDIPLDPNVNAQKNAEKYFKRAAKAERGLEEVPPRMADVESELHALDVLLERARPVLDQAAEVGATPDAALVRDIEAALATLPPTVRKALGAPPPVRPKLAEGQQGPRRVPPSRAAVARGDQRAPSARLQPRRLKTTDGWDVLIGRNNDGNDYLTHHLARPEDYWMHVHGAPGSHVVIRRGKGKNEPSKQTIEEVATWAAFYSQARTAGKVPVIVTQKKYVRKPRKAPPGLVVCEREKTVMVRPHEPPRESLADFEDGEA